MIGIILGNRYEILRKIGSGGMANVYLAHCRLLNRNVAVKVLKNEFANDKEFLERFNKEAQAAAAISSPNIVNVYDVGHYGDIHYIVMEYVEGQTLKEYIDQNGMLSWQETVEYAIQICSALDKAHKNGIVHRDIKPHNIILTNDGVLKVTDFGIARASSYETKNMEESTMGSVHYFSPEQARGGYTDAKSDIYSLGIVMYEMVTGILPFNGESPIAIAIKHMQEKPVSPKEFNISVPLAVESIILKAMSKEQSLRYQSAEEMLADLNSVMNKSGESLVNIPVNDGATIKMAPVNPIKDIPSEQTAHRPVHQENRRPVNNENGRTTRQKEKGNKRAVALAIVAAFAVLAAAVGIVAMFALGGGCTPSRELEIPNLKGMPYEEAFKKYDIENGGDFEIEMKEEKTDEYEQGTIINQTPSAGKMVKSNITITVTVAVPTESFVMPDYTKQKLDYFYGNFHDYEDEYELVVKVTEESNAEIEEGTIIRTQPAAKSIITKGDIIEVFVSKGGVKMQDLTGITFGNAKEWIANNKLKLKGYTPSGADDSYIVKEQSINPYEVISEGDEIELVLMKAPGVPEEPDEPSSSGGTEVKSKTVTIQIPQDRDSTVIRVLQDGEVIHNRRHDKSEGQIDIKVTGSGSVAVEIYFDSELTGSLTVNL